MNSLEQLQKEYNISVQFLKLEKDGSINPLYLESLLANSNKTQLVSLIIY